MHGRNEWSPQRFRHRVDCLGSVTLLNGGDNPRQVRVERGGTSEGLTQLVLERGCKNGAVGGDSGGNADLAKGGVYTRGHARALRGDNADSRRSERRIDH